MTTKEKQRLLRRLRKELELDGSWFGPWLSKDESEVYVFLGPNWASDDSRMARARLGDLEHTKAALGREMLAVAVLGS